MLLLILGDRPDSGSTACFKQFLAISSVTEQLGQISL